MGKIFSSQYFPQLQQQAKFERAEGNWANKWTVDEWKIIDQFANISSDNPESMEKQLKEFQNCKIENIINRLMIQSASVFIELEDNDPPPRKPPPPIPRRSSSLPPPRFSLIPPIQALQNFESFKELVAKAKEAVLESSFDAFELAFVKQILACQSLIEQNIPFLQAVQSCLSFQTLEKIMPKGSFKNKTRVKILEEIIAKLRACKLSSHSRCRKSDSEIKLTHPPKMKRRVQSVYSTLPKNFLELLKKQQLAFFKKKSQNTTPTLANPSEV